MRKAWTKMRPLEAFLSLCSGMSGLWFMAFADADARWPLYQPLHEIAPGWIWGLVLIAAAALASASSGNDFRGRGIKYTCYSVHLLFWISLTRFYIGIALDPPVVALSLCLVIGWGYLLLQLWLSRHTVSGFPFRC